MSITRTTSNGHQVLSDRRKNLGNALIRFCGFALLITSGVKFVHPAKAVAYMASMGFERGTFFLVAGLELLSAILFLLPATRRVGLLLVASYLGGATAAHLAIHRFLAGGPFLVYMATHRYIGALVPAGLLAIGCIGVWLSDPEVLPMSNKRINHGGEQVQRTRREVSIRSIA